jgi:hypothetical protein
MPEKFRVAGRGIFLGSAYIGLAVAIIGLPLVVARFFLFKDGTQGTINDRPAIEEASGKLVHRKRFEAQIQFSKDLPVMRVHHDARLDPAIDNSNIRFVSQRSDSKSFWAFFAAVKVRRLSGKGGARHIFALKYDADKPLHPGWGIAFHKIGNDTFPEVYWGTSRKKGLWYRFMPVSVHAGEWLAVGISFEEDRYLVLHTQPLYGEFMRNKDSARSAAGGIDQPIIPLNPFRGAHDLKEAGAASSAADLLLGATPGSAFKGGFGFFGVARVDQKISEGWFIEAVKLINSVKSTNEVEVRTEDEAEGLQKIAFKSVDLELVLGSLDGKQDLVTHKPLR